MHGALSPRALPHIADWMTYQRWYPDKGVLPRLELLRDLPLADEDDASMRILLLRGADGDVFQVPVTHRATIPKGAGPTLIGGDDDGGYLFDATHDVRFATALLAAIDSAGAESAAASRPIASRVMTAEQSNTSIVIEFEDRAPLIAKVFRVVRPGDNPEAIVQAALSEAGMPFVPAFAGSLRGSWPDVDGDAHGHLAVVQEFVEGARDGWSIALEVARDGDPFADGARQLGAATAAMHIALADRLPTRTPTTGDVVAMAASWHARLAAAIEAAPQLQPAREAIERVYDAAQEASWPRLQRVHGDLHLGQVLRTSSGEWRFVDFEGEPLRPLEERSRPDAALRDVAGMLRSFDYAAGMSDAPRGWADECRDAYLAGYAAGVADDVHDGLGFGPLLAALELDKAVYEVVYEARNRPAWIGIPLAAVERLVHAAAPAVEPR